MEIADMPPVKRGCGSAWGLRSGLRQREREAQWIEENEEKGD
jgi:hypothetical protein